MANTDSSRRPRRTRTRVATYEEVSSDEDQKASRTPRPQPRRSTRVLNSYEESDITNTSMEDEDSDEAIVNVRQAARRHDPDFQPFLGLSTSSRRSAPATPRSLREDNRSPASRPPSAKQEVRVEVGRTKAHARGFSGFKRRKLNSDRPRDKTKPSNIALPTRPHPALVPGAKVPPWQSLEHSILVKIMQYAATNTTDKADPGAFRWLLNTSEMCSTFHEACLAVLLRSPHLMPPHRAHFLIELLKASERDYGDIDQEALPPMRPGKISMDFRRKIKQLDVEVKQLLIKKQGIDLLELLRRTPLLSDLRLYHNHDVLYSQFVWAQAAHSKDRWAYSKDLFDTLDTHNIKLASFEWNGRFLRESIDLAVLPEYQALPCLSNVKHLSFLNLNVKNVEKDIVALADARQNLLTTLSRLPQLQSLAFDRCNIIDADTVAALSVPDLQELHINACPYVTSTGIQDLLQGNGLGLKVLSLTRNQFLDLGFLPTLSTTCPLLESIEIDLTFNDPTSFNDTEPLFDELLPNGPPTWPSTLQSIVIGPLRALSADDAEGFYSSLIDAASGLPYLRVLNIKTLLGDVSWRDRARLRSKWLTVFTYVFSPDPGDMPTEISSDDNKSAAASKVKLQNKRKSTRLQELEDTSVLAALSPSDTDSKPKQFKRQGRCHTLVFELSDQRPAQEQFNENDFLDSDPNEDDAEWNGDKQVRAPAYSARRYAW